jgi:branched-chain amino acid transport system permease protein
MSAEAVRRIGGRGAPRAFYASAFVLIAALPWLPVNDFVVHVVETFCYTAIAVIGLNVLLGLSGQMSLGQAGFYALGSYGSALAALRMDLPVPAAIALGTAVSAIGGALVGVFALRTRGLYLAMATMAIGFVIEILAQRWIGLTGGAMGLSGIPQFDMDGRFPMAFLYLAGGCLLAVLIATDYVNDSAIGRRLRAIRESEIFAASIGVRVPLWRATTFAGCAALAGLGGALFAHQSGYVGSDAFTVRLSVALLIAAVIGGLGTKRGPLLGTLILIGIVEFLSGVEKYGLLIYGAILLGVLTAFPEGAAGVFSWLRARMARASHGRAPALRTEDSAPLTGMPAGVGLSIEGVSKSYAGVLAVDRVSIEVAPNTVHGLIGPNGAGKSTLINVVAGLYRSDTGTIRLGGGDVTATGTVGRARLGLARTFQNLQLIEAVSALDNVLLGITAEQGLGGDFLAWWGGRAFESAQREEALGIMAFLGIAHTADRLPAELSYGHRKLIELARAIAQRPRLMLLDEPIAGLNAQEAREIAQVVRKLRDAGATIVVVEHNMEFVMSICDKVSVLNHGQLLATGTPAEVQAHPGVVSAYLGTSEAP